MEGDSVDGRPIRKPIVDDMTLTSVPSFGDEDIADNRDFVRQHL
jgi:hypothetical protein